MIAFSQPVRLGDYISVDGEFGTVEQISLLYTYIRSSDGRRVVIPNEAFASEVVNNFSMGSPGSMVAVDLVVPFDDDTPRALIVGCLPDVLVKGADWSHFVAGREEVEAAGGKVATLPLENGYSTTNIVERVAAGHHT